MLLRVWRDVPFPNWMRELFLRVINPSVMIGAMALIQDEQGRILVVEHTYRRQMPWGLPGGWLKTAESPEAGLMREVFEETGLHVRVEQLLAADFWTGSQFDLLFRCHVVSGTLSTVRRNRAPPLGTPPRPAGTAAQSMGSVTQSRGLFG